MLRQQIMFCIDSRSGSSGQGDLIDLKVSSNDVKHITRVDCLYVPHTVLLVGATTSMRTVH